MIRYLLKLARALLNRGMMHRPRFPTLFLVAALLPLGAGACSDSSDEDTPASSGTGGMGGDSGASGGAGGAEQPGEPFVEPEGCFQMEGSRATVALGQMRDDEPSACGAEEGANDATLIWRAPQSGRYRITSRGGDVDSWEGQGFEPSSEEYVDWSFRTPPLGARFGGCDSSSELICSGEVTYEDGQEQQLVVVVEEGDEIALSVQSANNDPFHEGEDYVVQLDIEESSARRKSWRAS